MVPAEIVKNSAERVFAMIPMTSNIRFESRAFKSSGLGPRFRSEIGRKSSNPDFLDIGSAGTRQARTLKAGESLFLQGDDVRSVCVLRDGWAFRYQSLEDGRRQIVDFVLPGDVLGIDSSPQMHYGVEALSPCVWLTISRESFLAQLRQQPALSMKLLDMLSTGQIRAFEQMTSVGRRTARERVAHLLLDLSRRVRKSASKSDSSQVTMPLMLSHIGDALGLATETVCRCLGELKREGILVFSAGRLTIIDLDGLSDLAGAPVEYQEEQLDSRHKRLVA